MLRKCDAERLRGLDINHEFELRWLLDRKISRLGTVEDFPNIIAGPPIHRELVDTVGHQMNGHAGRIEADTQKTKVKHFAGLLRAGRQRPRCRSPSG